ncbi:MAG TPA: fructosamine kinase family protein [Usitatibacteraceae bacterium]|nr:fructosamine kinase family protein [Usitatibacteraceae bacterium]
MQRIHDIARAVEVESGAPFRAETVTPIAGGSRWQTLKMENARHGKPGAVFVKLGEAAHDAVFIAECDGLAALAHAASGLRIPRPILRGCDDEAAWLVLEWIELSPLSASAAARAGEAFADLHRSVGSEFGWPRDNFIGASVQVNTPSKDWVEFFQHRRLLAQLHLAAQNRYPAKMIDRGERLVADLPALFRGYEPAASLLHGDPWAGNVAMDAEGRPVAFDPAVYRGDREADVAMCELFGGYPPEFFAAYRNAWALDAGYAVRKHLYNLYHILNHANLFAGSYVARAGEMIEQLLAEL